MTVPDRPPAVLAWPPRPARWVAGLPVGVLVGWQAALLVGWVALHRPAGQMLGWGAAAIALLVVTGLRPGQRWVYEWVVLWLRYQLRRRRPEAPGQPPELGLLRRVAGGAEVDRIGTEGREVAVLVHGYGWAAVLEIDADRQRAELPQLPLTLAPRHEPDAPAVCVQLLTHTTSAGARTWLVVQVRREAGHGEAELRSALTSALHRCQRQLRSAGVAARLVDRAGWSRVLRDLSWLGRPASSAPGPSTGGPSAAGSSARSPSAGSSSILSAQAAGVEEWRTWWAGGVPQASLAVRGWRGSPAPPPAALFDALHTAPYPRTVSVAARRVRLAAAHGELAAGEEVIAYELLVRVAERDRPGLAAAVRDLSARLAAAGASVERLDGRHLPSLAATLPTGGFLAGYPPSVAAFAPPPASAPPAPPMPAPPLPSASVPPARPVSAPPAFAQPMPPASAPPASPVSAPPALPTAPPARSAPIRGRARVPAPPTAATPGPARGLAQVPTAPERSAPASEQPTVTWSMPNVLRGITPPPASPPPTSPPPQPPGSAPPVSAPPAPPASAPPASSAQAAPTHPTALTAVTDRTALTALGLGTGVDPARRDWVAQVLALARTPHSTPPVVAVIGGKTGVGATTTATGLARTFGVARDDHPALLTDRADRIGATSIISACRHHTLVVADLGPRFDTTTAGALAVSTRVVLVRGAHRGAAEAARQMLDRIWQVAPHLAGKTVVVAVCKTGRQYERVVRELRERPAVEPVETVPIPPDPALQAPDDLELARLRPTTRDAFLYLAAVVAAPDPATAEAR